MAKLKISMGVIKSALDHSLNGICIVQNVAKNGAAQGHIVYVNPAFSQITGFHRTELLGKPPTLFTTPEIHFSLEAKEDSKVIEAPMPCKVNGQKIARRVLAKFTRFAHEGEQYIMGSFQDRTQLQQIEMKTQQLRHANLALYEKVGMATSRFTALLHHFPDVVWECDENFCYTFVSENVEQVLGYSQEALLGQPVYSHMGETFQDFFQDIFPKGEPLLDLQRIVVSFFKPNGREITLELLSHLVLSDGGGPFKMIGTSRDVTALLRLEEDSKAIAEGMEIKVDEQLRLAYVSPNVADFLAEYSSKNPPDFQQYLSDTTVGALFSFAFAQKEDLPFPVEIQFKDAAEVTRNFRVELAFNPEENCLAGQLVPLNTNDQVTVIAHHIEKQQESLKKAVVLNAEMQATVIRDSQNLAHEILNLIKSLEEVGYPQEDHFDLQDYETFLEEKNCQAFEENIRLLGNKIHGLKGTSGFLIPASKKLCHRIEDLTRPLAQCQLVLTSSLAHLLKQFIFKIQEMLEEYQKDSETLFDVEDWIAQIDHALETGTDYLGEKKEGLAKLIANQNLKMGEVEKQTADEFISVSMQGYDLLSEQAQTLFQMASENLTEDKLVKAGGIYNDFLDTHQKIIKVPLDLSRYERLIPIWASEYDKEAEFVFKDHGVYADREFWNATHEIFNHSLKNAVIHGLEAPQEREAQGKEPKGLVTVEIQEDALHLYLSILDDGRGINVKKMKEKAIENQVISLEQAQTMSEEAVLDLVFVQGMSTAESLDDNAGRGVGMNAVQEVMHHFQGKVKIVSQAGEGTAWNFIFPKSNVSLPCFIVTIGGFQIAIPENHVEGFCGYHPQHISQINQKSVFRHANELIPLLNSKRFFDAEVRVNESLIRRIMILQADQQKIGMMINNIVHHATLPILPLPEEYRGIPAYLGATLYGNQPVLVLNAHQMFLN